MADILDIIKADMKRKQGKYPGRYFYNYKPNKPGTDKQYFIKNGVEYEVTTKNSEIYINYFKMLVTQKIDYLLAKNPTYDKTIKDAGINVWTMLDKLVLNASLDSKTWLHPYTTKNKLSYIVIKDSEIIPKYTADNKELEQVIRYYKEDENLNVEIWTNEGVKYLVYNKENILLDEKTESHYTTKYYAGDTVEQTIDSNFPTIPFICLENNKDMTGDIEDIENLIIAYNGICTGFVENVEKFQEALLVLRGYVGENADIKEAMEKLREAKGVSVDKDGDAGYMTVEIPVEARNVLLNILRDVIFLIGRGVDPSKLAEGTQITNTVIKSRYIQLDLKSSDCEKRIVEFYNKFIDFLNSFSGQNYNTDLEFNKSMLINESERIDDCLKSLNILSLETILENHPFVKKGVKDELARIKKEKEEKIKEMQDMGLDPFNTGDGNNDTNGDNNQNNKNNPSN